MVTPKLTRFIEAIGPMPKGAVIILTGIPVNGLTIRIINSWYLCLLKRLFHQIRIMSLI